MNDIQTRKPGTRRRILELLKLSGNATSEVMAGEIGVTAMAVRQHLYGLEAEGLVGWREKPNPRGRPSKMWRLTDEGNNLFPNAHADLTVELISALRTALGEPGLDQVLTARRNAQLKTYLTALEGRDGLEDKLEGLAALRTREGYMCDITANGDGSFALVERHCPICTAAKACQGLCRSELKLFRDVLGKNVHVERKDHIVKGATRCVYAITPSA